MDKGNENGNGNGNTVLLTVIGVATLLVALVGATFAYFSATIQNNAQESVTLTTAAPVGLEYLAQTQVEIPNAVPGQSATGQFTVKNPNESTVDQKYDLELVIEENGFTTGLPDATLFPNAASSYPAGTTTLPKQLFLSVSGTGTTNTPTIAACTTDAPCDLTDGTTAYPAGKHIKLVQGQRIGIGETQTYTVNLNFVDLEMNFGTEEAPDMRTVSQDANQGKNFSSHILITNPVSVKTTTTPGA